MSLSVTFRHAARAELIEAAAWYEGQRPDLGVDFIAEIERCVDAASGRPTTYPAITKDVAVSLPIGFHPACTFERKNDESSFWLRFTAVAIPLSGSTGPENQCGVPKERKFEPTFRNP
jgi:hypothetical protein